MAHFPLQNYDTCNGILRKVEIGESLKGAKEPREREREKERGREKAMEWAGKAMDVLTRGSNSNTVINVFLVSAFAALGVRSVKQQRDIDALEAERDSLLKTNKALKKSMWDWRQQLFAQAATGSSSVPLSKLKSIYGEVAVNQQDASGAQTNEGSRTTQPKFVV